MGRAASQPRSKRLFYGLAPIIDEEKLDEELRYVRSEIYRWNEADPPVKRLTAFDRFRA